MVNDVVYRLTLSKSLLHHSCIVVLTGVTGSSVVCYTNTCYMICLAYFIYFFREYLKEGIGLEMNIGLCKYASHLVDPASSHMLVSKIKPCMSKFKLFKAKLRMAH